MKKILKLLILLFLVTGFWIQSSTNLSAQVSNEGDGDVSLICPECPNGGIVIDDDGNIGGGGNGPNPGNGGGGVGIDPSDIYWYYLFDAVDDGIDDDPFNNVHPFDFCRMELTSQTVVTVPSNRDRTTLAIGEIILVTVPNLCPTLSTSWSIKKITGTEASIVPGSSTPTSCRVNAGLKPGMFTVVLTITGSSPPTEDCKECLRKKEIKLNFNVTCPRLISETEATMPSNRARAKVGIGEKIEVLLLGGNQCAGSPVWSINNLPGTTTPVAKLINGFDKIIESGDIPGKFEISVNLGAECSDVCPEKILKKEFEVIKPSGTTFKYNFPFCPTKPIHVQNKVSMLFWVDFYLLPDDVSFYNILVQELDCEAKCEGPYVTNAPLIPCPTTHAPNPGWSTMTNVVLPGYGTKGTSQDELKFILPCDKDWSATKEGTIRYEIPWRYYRADGQHDKFTTVIFSAKNHGGTNSKFTVTKGNLILENNLQDENNCSSATCN